jgi:hypothetical protein
MSRWVILAGVATRRASVLIGRGGRDPIEIIFVWKLIEGQPPPCERMTGLSSGQLVDLVDRVREVVGPWENPPVARPHVLPLPMAVVAVLFGLRHNMPDEVLAEVFGCSQATITRYREILHPILRWVTRPGGDDQLERARRAEVLVDGFVAPVGEREHRLQLQRQPAPHLRDFRSRSYHLLQWA